MAADILNQSITFSTSEIQLSAMSYNASTRTISPIPERPASDARYVPYVCVIKGMDVLLEICTFLFTIVDMSLVLVLVYRHYMAEQALEAWAMLLPVLFSTLGVQYFFDKFPPENHWYNEILNVPLLGTIFCSGEMLYAKLMPVEEEALRQEAESIKLKQYESIFRAYPEGVVMLTVLLIHHDDQESTDTIETWVMEILCAVFAAVSLAEAHWYGIVSDYYRIHNKKRLEILSHEERERPHQLHLWQKFILFLHAFLAIGSRLCAEALLRAGVYFALNDSYFSSSQEAEGKDNAEIPIPKHRFVEMMLIVFFAEVVVRTVLHIVFQLFIKMFRCCFNYCVNRVCHYERLNRVYDEHHLRGLHGAIQHGFLTTFCPLGFQSKYIYAIVWYYVENIICIVAWVCLVTITNSDSGVRFLKYDHEIITVCVSVFLLALAFQAIASYLTMPNVDNRYVIQMRHEEQRYLLNRNDIW